MCWEYKLAYLSWYVSCYPALMVNLIWFADDKFLKFYSCNTKKCAKQLHLRVCGDSLIFACLSKTVHQHTEFARWLNFWLDRHLISAPMQLSANMMNIFSLTNHIKFTIKAR